MELDLLGLLGSTTTAAAGDMHMHGSGTHHARAAVRSEKMAALMSAAMRDDELRRPREVAACPKTPPSFGDHHRLLQVPRLPPNDEVVAAGQQGHALAVAARGPSPPQDARGVLLAASAGGANGLAGTPPAVAGLASQQPHHSAATTIERSTAAADHAIAKVTIFCAGATQVLDNVPREMVEQFVLSVAKATGAPASPPVQHQPKPAASPGKTHTMKLLGPVHDEDGDLLMTRRKASLARFLHKRAQRARRSSARNKEMIAGIQNNRNEYCDEDALLTELKI